MLEQAASDLGWWVLSDAQTVYCDYCDAGFEATSHVLLRDLIAAHRLSCPADALTADASLSAATTTERSDPESSSAEPEQAE